MNREIKFRSWNPITRQFMALNLRDRSSVEFVYSSFDYIGHLQQYTGLRDKNGIEIYEGDILLTNEDPGEGLDSHINMIVKWDSDFLKYIVFNEDCSLDLGYYPQDELEVIGNRYENPELREKSKND